MALILLLALTWSMIPSTAGTAHAGVGVRKDQSSAITAARGRSSVKGFTFSRPLGPGDLGRDVRALQIRIAGWFPSATQVFFVIDGVYGDQTEQAVGEFRRNKGLRPSARASKKVLGFLQELQDPDGSTAHFDWVEFAQNSSLSCSAEANANAGTFGGGKVSPRVVKRNVKKMMWRLEAVRAKAGGTEIGINSAFRSVAYNECIGGASSSQHMYGTAVDNRIVETANETARVIAMGSQIHGIGCYSDLSHNHFDIRLNNWKLVEAQAWWWPEKDRKGRDLDEAGVRCWGQGKSRVNTSSPEDSQLVIGGIVIGGSGSGTTRPSETEVQAFEEGGETGDYRGMD